MCSYELLLNISALDFERLCLNTQNVELNLEFFRQENFDSNADWNEEVNYGYEVRLEVSELGRMS